MAKYLRERLTNLETVNGIKETKEKTIQFVIIDCDLFVIQSTMTICGKHHLQTQEQYESSKVKAIQIIIVDCDPLVIQSTVKNLWRKGQGKAKEQTEYQQQQGGPETSLAIQVVFINCDLFVIQFMMAICGKHHKQSRKQYKAN